MKPEDLNKNLTEDEIDGLIRSYGRVPTQKSNVAIITQIMNTTVEDFEPESIEHEEVRSVQVEEVEEVEQVEEAQLQEEQDDDFA